MLLGRILSLAFESAKLTNVHPQAGYLSRLDYQWKRQLTKEQDEAFHTRNANKLLLRNILPEHVGTRIFLYLIHRCNCSTSTHNARLAFSGILP